MHNHRIAGAAKVAGHLFGPLEWRVHCPGPADRDVRLAFWSADLINPLDDAGKTRIEADEACYFIKRSFESTFGASAVVADDVHHQRVVKFAGFFQTVDETADLVIGISHVRGEVLHELEIDPLRVRGL